ncbi:uncharacterized protein LOC143593152 [Bidens hawaiensis]|uniref:uncharacterized protein LOC143593152 n=1 Tax=Bidens hawaiensis TaxID=980011 RepID=UPI00404AC509
MQGENADSGSSPSFSCYSSSDSITSTAIAKVISEEHAARLHIIDDQDFEFGLVLNDEIAFFPLFNRNSKDHETDASSITGAFEKLLIDQPEESSSCSSSEADELEHLPSGTFCVSHMTRCKKSSSTGSGSKRWRFRYFLRRSNSEGKEPMVLLTSKKEKRNPGEVSKVAQTPVHEQFYVQRRAENEVGKRKSYLPYMKDLVGLFGNVNGMGKMLPF